VIISVTAFSSRRLSMVSGQLLCITLVLLLFSGRKGMWSQEKPSWSSLAGSRSDERRENAILPPISDAKSRAHDPVRQRVELDSFVYSSLHRYVVRKRCSHGY